MTYEQGTDFHDEPSTDSRFTLKALRKAQHDPGYPHEAWHVAQQLPGRVEPVGGFPMCYDLDMEYEADVMKLHKKSPGNDQQLP